MNEISKGLSTPVINFEKNADGLIPAIIQDAETEKVLMQGYMNAESLEQTAATGFVTFFSRSRKEIWVKGATSGHFLYAREILSDCDRDCILIKANPNGPVCHTGADTCFNERNETAHFIPHLEKIIEKRINSQDRKSYTFQLYEKGINKVAQKVGEEAVELLIESKDNDEELFLNEAADLMFHFLVLLKAKNHSLREVESVLRKRHEERG